MEYISDSTNRLDKFLASKVDVSRSRVQKSIKDGLVLVNGEKVIETDFSLKANDIVTLPEFESEDLKPSSIKLNVVYENEDFAVIDKPAGMVVHPGAGNKEDTLANALLTTFPGIETVGEPHRPGIVHRLDEDTSGLILIAKTAKGYDYAKQMFMDRNVEKEYLALVHGVPGKKHDIINVPLEKVPLKQKMKVGSGKEAVTEYWVVAEGVDETALLRVKLHTGRTHQIRAHLSHIGLPIVGDAVYGKQFYTQDSKFTHRQFLHAARLKFQLPDQTWIELESQLPKELQDILNNFKIKY